jgi:hypothetical protein
VALEDSNNNCESYEEDRINNGRNGAKVSSTRRAGQAAAEEISCAIGAKEGVGMAGGADEGVVGCRVAG